MVLDALIKIKNEMDSTLTFRRSCREGKWFLVCLAPRAEVCLRLAVPGTAAGRVRDQQRGSVCQPLCRLMLACLRCLCPMLAARVTGTQHTSLGGLGQCFPLCWLLVLLEPTEPDAGLYFPVLGALLKKSCIY